MYNHFFVNVSTLLLLAEKKNFKKEKKNTRKNHPEFEYRINIDIFDIVIYFSIKTFC